MSITSSGFTKETLQEIIVRLSNQMKESFPNINLTQANIIYQWLKVVALEIYYLQTIIDDTIANITPLGASGMFLDYHALNAGIQRKGSVQALGSIQLTNETELGKYTIPAGTEVSTPSGLTYVTLDNVSFNDYIPIIHSGGGAGSIDAIDSKYYYFTVDSSLHNEATYSSDAGTTLTVTEDLSTYIEDGGTGYVYIYNNTTWIQYEYTFASASPHDLVLNIAPDYGSLSVYYECDDGLYYYSSITDANDNTILGFYSIDASNKLLWETSMIPLLGTYQQYYLGIIPPLTITASIVATAIGSEGNTGANTITVNKNSVEGIDIINNAAALDNGSDQEEDSSLRARILEVSNAKTTLADIKTTVKNITGVRHAKATNNKTDDRAFPSDWTQATSSPTTKIDLEAGKVVQIAHRLLKEGVSTICGLELRLKDIGDAPTLYVYLANHSSGMFTSPEETHVADATITKASMIKNGAGIWQDVFIPLEYNSLYSSNTYSINIYCPDGSVSGGNYWQIQIMDEDYATPADQEVNNDWYDLHREWNLEATLAVVTATAAASEVTTEAHSITGTGYIVIAGDSYYFSAASTPTFTLSTPLSLTYTLGTPVYVYQSDDTNLDDDAKAAIYRTMFTNSTFTVSVIPEDSYDFETDLKEDIINMLDWEEGEGYAPLCIKYDVREATQLNLAITAGELSILDNYVFDDVKAEIMTNINTYLSLLEPGEDIVYSQVEKIVLITAGVYRFRNMTLVLTRGITTVTSTAGDEVDLIIYDDEYTVMTDITLTEG